MTEPLEVSTLARVIICKYTRGDSACILPLHITSAYFLCILPLHISFVYPRAILSIGCFYLLVVSLVLMTHGP